MKVVLCTFILLVGMLPLRGLHVFSDQHVDLAVNFVEGQWEIRLEERDGSQRIGRDPDNALLWVLWTNTLDVIPGDPASWGEVGEAVWLLPQSIIPGERTIFLGWNAENTPSGVLQPNSTPEPLPNGEIGVRVLAVEGPGDFGVFQSGIVGPVLYIDSADGLDESDFFALNEGGHDHSGWFFTKPGLYRVTLQAFGNLADGTPTQSAPTVIRFVVSEWIDLAGETFFEAWQAEQDISSPGENADGDVFSAAEEYLLNTSPSTPNDFLPLTDMGLSTDADGAPVLSFQTHRERVYQVWSGPSPAALAPIGDPVPGTGERETWRGALHGLGSGETSILRVEIRFPE